jgi:hypothetical protein
MEFFLSLLQFHNNNPNHNNTTIKTLALHYQSQHHHWYLMATNITLIRRIMNKFNPKIIEIKIIEVK